MKYSNNYYKYTFFETPIGKCAIAWSDAGIKTVVLPHSTLQTLEAAIKKHIPKSKKARPNAETKQAITFINNLLSGKKPNVSEIPKLDMEGTTPFYSDIYKILQKVPVGRTITYKDLAIAAGKAGAARAAAGAMARNRLPLLIPCHRVIGSDGKLHGFSAEGGIKTQESLLKFEGTPLPSGKEVKKEVKYATLENPQSIREGMRYLACKDPIMKKFMASVGDCKLEVNSTSTLFESLLESIVYQQLTAKAASKIFARLLDLFRPKQTMEPFDILRASDEELRSAGLSGAKVAAIRDLAEKTASGELLQFEKLSELDDETIIKQLTKVRGIGRWTVEMLLIFKLGRPDVLSSGDYGLRKGYAALYNGGILPSPKELAAAGEKWKPWRSIASWYLWRAAESFQRVMGAV